MYEKAFQNQLCVPAQPAPGAQQPVPGIQGAGTYDEGGRLGSDLGKCVKMRESCCRRAPCAGLDGQFRGRHWASKDRMPPCLLRITINLGLGLHPTDNPDER